MPSFECPNCAANSDAEYCDCYPIFTGKPQFKNGTTFNKNKSKRYISCELEYSNIFGFQNVAEHCYKSKHNIVSDGSIEGSFPFEICTCPTSGDEFLQEIQDLTKVLGENKVAVNKSCGFHVHIDSRDMNFYDLRKFAMIYCKIEDYIFECLPLSRRNSEFCNKCASKLEDLFLGRIRQKPKGRFVREFYGLSGWVLTDNRIKEHLNCCKNDKYYYKRYWALNIHSWMMRGTLENRCAAGTYDYEKIVNWALLWAYIIDYAVENTEKNIKELINNCVSHEDLLKIILEKDTKVYDWLCCRYTIIN